MENSYLNLIKHTFNFPQSGFSIVNNNLNYNGLSLKALVEKHGSPIKINYLPIISHQIQNAKSWFNNSFSEYNYQGSYRYCYCTKSNHFSHVLDQILKNNVDIELSSSYDVDLINRLYQKNRLKSETKILCNGYKSKEYIRKIVRLKKESVDVIPILDNLEEIKLLREEGFQGDIGLRIAVNENPNSQFYTSRFGIDIPSLIDFYIKEIKDDKLINLTMFHFFITTGISDTPYYWNELLKMLEIYASLKEVCPSLNILNIGGGFPVRNSLKQQIDYQGLVSKIVSQIKKNSKLKNIPEPNIVTEFGAYTVAKSGVNIFEVVAKKSQNDKENWYFIDNSFMNTLPDSWGINKRFVLLALNHWDKPYTRVSLGGITCDSDDYYNSEAHYNELFLPNINYPTNEPLYLAFFNTGAYQDNIAGYGGVQHCLIPYPKQIIIDKSNKTGKLEEVVFREKMKPKEMLKILGY